MATNRRCSPGLGIRALTATHTEVQVLIIISGSAEVPLLRVPAFLLRVHKNLYRVEPDLSILPNSEYQSIML
jgi:hypothetical protein